MSERCNGCGYVPNPDGSCACGSPDKSELASSTGYLADVESGVCEDIKARQRRGVAKYGTTVAANTLSEREWLQHAYEEALDLAIYLKRIIDGTQPDNVRMSDRPNKISTPDNTTNSEQPQGGGSSPCGG